MHSTGVKTIVQCDFDSTIAEDDISFMLLDAFADGDWRQVLKEYREHKIPVGIFNAKSFGMIKADKQTMLEYIFKSGVKVRAGFDELLSYCAKKGYEFVIVSNGLSFYIKAILKDIGVDNIEIFASEAESSPDGLKVKYIGPDGRQMQDDFKKSYVELFMSRGYRVVYIGDGYSDIIPASLADYIFARDDLLAHCQEKRLPKYTPFDDLNDVVRGLEVLE